MACKECIACGFQHNHVTCPRCKAKSEFQRTDEEFTEDLSKGLINWDDSDSTEVQDSDEI